MTVVGLHAVHTAARGAEPHHERSGKDEISRHEGYCSAFLDHARMLPRAPRKIDTTSMERKLRDEGYSVTRRTIQWDLH
jgi:hypothetical protein